MKSESVQLARSAERQRYVELAQAVVSNPLVLGFGGLLANHALYKAGWYSPNVKIKGGLFGMFGQPLDISEANMHDTIALFIMIASIVASAKAPLADLSKSLALVAK